VMLMIFQHECDGFEYSSVDYAKDHRLKEVMPTRNALLSLLARQGYNTATACENDTGGGRRRENVKNH
jgi:hypothetical protein